MGKEIALVLPVAGLSSRFGGRIKQFALVGPSGETLIEYSLNQALSAGFTKVIFIVGEMTEKPFREKFGISYRGIPVFYVKQEFDMEERDKPWGTTDALCCVRGIIDCPFVFCNGDDIYGANTFRKLVGHLRENRECATVGYMLGGAIPDEGDVKRAIFRIDGNYVLDLMETFGINKKSLGEKGLSEDSLCSMNIFALYPETVEMLNGILIKFKEENKGDREVECLLPDDISDLIRQGKIKMRIYPSVDKWYGVTNPEDEVVVGEQLKSI